jgi:hypothetical protein
MQVIRFDNEQHAEPRRASPSVEPQRAQANQRSTFETILEMFRSSEDLELHDGWQPVRERRVAGEGAAP